MLKPVENFKYSIPMNLRVSELLLCVFRQTQFYSKMPDQSYYNRFGKIF